MATESGSKITLLSKSEGVISPSVEQVVFWSNNLGHKIRFLALVSRPRTLTNEKFYINTPSSIMNTRIIDELPTRSNQTVIPTFYDP